MAIQAFLLALLASRRGDKVSQGNACLSDMTWQQFRYASVALRKHYPDADNAYLVQSSDKLPGYVEYFSWKWISHRLEWLSWLERRSHNPKIASSTLASSIFLARQSFTVSLNQRLINFKGD